MKQFNILYYLLPFLCFSCGLKAQHEADNWYFGRYSGITFSTNPPSVLYGSQMNQYEGSSSISDASGNLLFYTDGITVWDRTHTPMPNGTGLWGHTSTTQCLIVPKPGSSSLYYIFTPPYYYSTNPLAYSVVDMTLNGGFGDVYVTAKNVALLDSSTEKVAAVRHANGSDIWVLAHTFGDSAFHAFLLTSSGINPVPVSTSIGSVHTDYFYCKAGYLKFSAQGNKVAAAVLNDSFFELFDFDNVTGILSHPLHFSYGSSTEGFYGLEFSPDGSKLYAGRMSPYVLLQYNLLAASDSAIVASADSIYFSTQSSSPPTALQTGPDGRIYCKIFDSEWLSCINNPNILGDSCNFITNFIYLDSNTITNASLPCFFASYFYGLNTSAPNIQFQQSSLSLSPNPAIDYLQVNYSIPQTSKNIEIVLSDISYRPLIKQGIPLNKKSTSFNISHLKPGCYFVSLNFNGSTKEVKRFIKN